MTKPSPRHIADASVKLFLVWWNVSSSPCTLLQTPCTEEQKHDKDHLFWTHTLQSALQLALLVLQSLLLFRCPGNWSRGTWRSRELGVFHKRSHEINSLWVEKSSQPITKIISRQPKSHQFKSCLRLEKLRALLINIEQPSQVGLELMEEMLLTETWRKYIPMPMCIYIVIYITNYIYTYIIHNIWLYMSISQITHRATRIYTHVGLL